MTSTRDRLRIRRAGWQHHPAVRSGDQLTLGERAADRLRNLMGSWGFVIAALLFLAGWMLGNRNVGFDKYPFILLNLVLSCVAALQGAILLIAAKREDQISSELARHDYETNLEADQIVKEIQALTRQIHAQTVPRPDRPGDGVPAEAEVGRTGPAEEPTWRYARPEHERRFLLGKLPDDASAPRLLTDRFVSGTRLRLRVVRDGVGGPVIQRKAGHKVRPDPADPTVVAHTSLYLNQVELDVLARLDGVDAVKTRYDWSHEGRPAVVDVYGEPLSGLVVAELGFADAEALLRFRPTPPLGPEITRVEALTGPALAGLSPADLARELHRLDRA